MKRPNKADYKYPSFVETGDYSKDMNAYADHLESELTKARTAATRWYYKLRDFDPAIESEKGDLPNDLESQLAERDKQLAALKNELGHDRVEQAEYIAARDARIKELEQALRDICTDENDAATRIARIALKGATDAKA